MLKFTRVLADESYQQMPRARLGHSRNGKSAPQGVRVCILDGSHMHVTDSLTLSQVSLT